MDTRRNIHDGLRVRSFHGKTQCWNTFSRENCDSEYLITKALRFRTHFRKVSPSSNQVCELSSASLRETLPHPRIRSCILLRFERRYNWIAVYTLRNQAFISIPRAASITVKIKCKHNCVFLSVQLRLSLLQFLDSIVFWQSEYWFAFLRRCTRAGEASFISLTTNRSSPNFPYNSLGRIGHCKIS